jgi:hypothetical protein
MDELDSATSVYIPKLKHRTYGLSLYKTATTINPTLVYQRFNEQRRYPRFKPDTQIFVLHSTQGTVDDISMGGLSYTYHQLPKKAAKPLPEVSTLFSAGKDYLFDIPSTVVTDTIIRKAYSYFPELKQRRICFNGLTEKQFQELELFILTHAIIPTPDSKKQRHPAARDRFDHRL